MVEEWAFLRVVYLDGARFVVVGQNRPIGSGGEDDFAGIDVRDNLLRYGGCKESLCFG